VALVACGFAVGTVANRLPLRGRYLFNWDALQFALGIQRFDLAAHRPHPPGHIGYIYLGRLLTHLTGATIESVLTAVSIAGEAATVVGLCRRRAVLASGSMPVWPPRPPSVSY